MHVGPASQSKPTRASDSHIHGLIRRVMVPKTLTSGQCDRDFVEDSGE